MLIRNHLRHLKILKVERRPLNCCLMMQQRAKYFPRGINDNKE